MTLTPEQIKQFEALTKPLIQWLNENAHPHVTAIVTPVGAEVLEGLMAYQTMEFVKD